MNTILLQTQALPTFPELVNNYGPFLGLIIFLVICFMTAQYFWSRSVIRAKNQEIARLVQREDELSKRILHLIDKKISYKEPKEGK
jgi:uncharacterized membrane protein